MALFLVRQGRSLPEKIDPLRRLSREGISEVECVAAHAQDRGIRIDTIVHGPAASACQTAEIMASYLKPGREAAGFSGMGRISDVRAFSGAIAEKGDIMVVMNRTFLERLCSYLVMGSAENRMVSLRYGGMACLEKNPRSRAWVVRWTLMPGSC